jgi:hypothetical protein
MHPIAGTWTANLAKSKRDENHQFASATMRFDVSGAVDETVVLRYGGVNHSGTDESAAHTMSVDGVERPIPQAPGVVGVCRWAGPRALETIGKKDGAVVGHATYEASEDGTELTATVTGIDAKGLRFEQVIVFDRAVS